MKHRALAEMIILQALEDLIHPKRSIEASEFFASSEFIKLTKAAGMDSGQTIKLLEYVVTLSGNIKSIMSRKVAQRAGRASTSPRALPAPSLAY